MKKLITLVSIISLVACRKEDIVVNVYKPIEVTTTKTVEVKDTFSGYRIDPNSKYINNTPLLTDLIVGAFQKNYEVFAPPQKDAYCVFSTQICNGDFNGDGYLDVFNAGTAYGAKKANLTFLLWDKSTLTFIEKNLINDSTNFIGAPYKVEPYNLNSDNYTDLVIFGHVDEGNPAAPNEPMRIAVSDGKGGYDLTKLNFLIPSELQRFTIEGGDLGDLNGDGLPDLVVCCNSHTFIFWGIPNYPYFTNKGYGHFAYDTKNFKSDNGFGEIVPDGSGAVYSAKIADVNNDGQNDILLGSGESIQTNTTQRILINQGKGRFSKSGVIKLPYFSTITTPGNIHDFIVDDLNGDGRTDIIGINSINYNQWSIIVYIQQTDSSFKIDDTWVNYTISTDRKTTLWKYRLVYYDFDGDGKKDITYLDAGIDPYTNPNNKIKYKTVFIRSGNQFVEKNIYSFDQYAKSIIDKLHK